LLLCVVGVTLAAKSLRPVFRQVNAATMAVWHAIATQQTHDRIRVATIASSCYFDVKKSLKSTFKECGPASAFEMVWIGATVANERPGE
jgi:hypothetical protein